MLARKRKGAFRWMGPSLGLNVAKALSCTSSVRASLRSKPYSPVHRNVFSPGSTSSAVTSTPRPRSSSRCSRGKSLPTAPTTRTWLKKLAEYEKYVADPPRASLTLPNGVWTLSSATEPTTTRSATPGYFPRCREMPGEEQVEALPGPRREVLRSGDDRVPERLRAPAAASVPDERDDPAQDILGHRDILHEVGNHGLDGDGIVLRMPHVVVGHQRQCRIAELGLAGELGLGHVRHADDGDAPPAVDLGLPPGRELRALDADVGAALVNAPARLAPGLGEGGRKGRTHGMRHADMGHDAVAEEGGHAAPGMVVELVGDDHVQRVDLLLHASDGAHGEQDAGAELPHPVDIGAIVELRGREPVPAAVAGEEDDPTAAEAAGAVGV